MFGSKHYRKVFLIRFLAYFLIQVGLLSITLTLEPVLNEELSYQFNKFLGKEYVVPNVVTSQGTIQATPDENSSFKGLLSSNQEVIVPVSTDFGIVIEKINANAKVIANVDASNESDYNNALAKGVAHAKGTSLPGEKGNIFLFSHSTDAPWNIVRYNAIFYLLSKLESGDRIILYYKGRRYDYIVFDKAIVKPDDTQYLKHVYDVSVLTLQTCDPPGTLINRLIVRARLASS